MRRPHPLLLSRRRGEREAGQSPSALNKNGKRWGQAGVSSTARVRLNRTTATAFGQIEPRAIAIGEDRSVTIYAFLVNNGCEARA